MRSLYPPGCCCASEWVGRVRVLVLTTSTTLPHCRHQAREPVPHVVLLFAARRHARRDGAHAHCRHELGGEGVQRRPAPACEGHQHLRVLGAVRWRHTAQTVVVGVLRNTKPQCSCPLTRAVALPVRVLCTDSRSRRTTRPTVTYWSCRSSTPSCRLSPSASRSTTRFRTQTAKNYRSSSPPCACGMRGVARHPGHAHPPLNAFVVCSHARRYGTTARTRVSPSLPRTSVYFHRELLTTSPENRRVDLLTVSSYEGRWAAGQRVSRGGSFSHTRTTSHGVLL